MLYTNWLLLAHVLAVAILVALFRRRWRLARLMVLAPLVGWLLVQVLKHLFGRHVVDYLAYPSGHLTAGGDHLGPGGRPGGLRGVGGVHRADLQLPRA